MSVRHYGTLRRDATKMCAPRRGMDIQRRIASLNRVSQKLCVVNCARELRLKLGRAEKRESVAVENEGGSKPPPVFNDDRASGERMALARRTGVSAGVWSVFLGVTSSLSKSFRRARQQRVTQSSPSSKTWCGYGSPVRRVPAKRLRASLAAHTPFTTRVPRRAAGSLKRKSSVSFARGAKLPLDSCFTRGAESS